MVGLAQTEKEFLEETAQRLAADNPSLAEALPPVYDELRRMAASYLRGERASHTLQPTALVHEAYLRLRTQQNVDWSNRAQFLGVAARMMRWILVNHAASRSAQKRGGAASRVALDAALDVFEKQDVSALVVNSALDRLETLNPRQAQIAEMRFFGGMTLEEVGEALDVSLATVKRDWTMAKLWFERELRRD
jgi:RNA polymerase sigma factor (TIGR02999 family)